MNASYRKITTRLGLAAGAIAVIVGCAFVQTTRDLPASQMTGFPGYAMSASWEDPKFLLYSSSAGSVHELRCFSPKANLHDGSLLLQPNEILAAAADDPSSPRSFAGKRQWAVADTGDAGLHARVIPVDYRCNEAPGGYTLPSVPLGSAAKVTDFDIAPDGTHYLIVRDFTPMGTSWRMIRRAVDGTMTSSTLTARPDWGSSHLVKLSYDADTDKLFVGNHQRVVLDPTTLVQQSTSDLPAPPSFTALMDFAVFRNYTVGLLQDIGGTGQVVLYTPSGQLDTSTPSIPFDTVRSVDIAPTTVDYGTANNGCGESLKFLVFGERSTAVDSAQHYAHQFILTAGTCSLPTSNPSF